MSDGGDSLQYHRSVGTSSPALEFALIVRREPHPSNDNQAALKSITVQSPLIRKALEAVFDGYEGLETRLRQLTFEAPFHSFYYRWHRFESLRNLESDESTKAHLTLLYNIISQEILPYIHTMQDFTKNRVISFTHLWTIFAPGTEVYTKIKGHDCAVRLKSSSYGANMSGEYFSLECMYIDCDGSNFGYVDASVEINSFAGVKRLSDLEAIPIHLHPNIEELVERLHIRGDKFEQLNGFHHMSYSGFYTARSSRQVRNRHIASGRIIVDPHTFGIYSMSGPSLAVLENDRATTYSSKSLFKSGDSVIRSATEEEFRMYEEALQKCQELRDNNSNPTPRVLSCKQRLLCAPSVRGYCLTAKIWAEFDVEKVSRITWSTDVFARLVLPRGTKEIIRAFVQEQLSHDDGFDDIVSGKVAEEMCQPLYAMSAGELGETAAEVEEQLEMVLELTAKWNAILLLDECDMFLEARTTADIRRNRLISIFLRKLEYYRGVMFLTSNRIDDFDPAFESRIHLTIHYPALDTAKIVSN
ncbi:hypothetical protein M7I_1116 [Glarea lozoyensis 74030]|uniref:Uncharacterized protein n=1 Tax=Glarea lozoyensis (strain ATCC 74030 / MF5533) TaxID=1104152 RepID=H0EF77_GLAL7|nr:hypothetical protein M7I_1116 [Glarea lozoyensis 74030]